MHVTLPVVCAIVQRLAARSRLTRTVLEASGYHVASELPGHGDSGWGVVCSRAPTATKITRRRLKLAVAKPRKRRRLNPLRDGERVVEPPSARPIGETAPTPKEPVYRRWPRRKRG